MGLFDTIWLSCECPYYGEEKERDIQTKDGCRLLEHYRVGDKFPISRRRFHFWNGIDDLGDESGDPFVSGQRWISGIANCDSTSCRLEAAILHIIRHDKISSPQMYWDAKILLDEKNRITEEVAVVKTWERAPDDWEAQIKDQAVWKEFAERYELGNIGAIGTLLQALRDKVPSVREKAAEVVTQFPKALEDYSKRKWQEWTEQCEKRARRQRRRALFKWPLAKSGKGRDRSRRKKIGRLIQLGDLG